MLSKTRVLVVDDSAFARSVIAKKLACDDLEIIDFAKDGIEALEKTRALQPDVITLDVSMPRMDGLDALERIMAECPTPVVMLSALTGEQTQTTISALEGGAVDFFLKPSVTSPAGSEGATEELRNTIRAAATVTGSKLKSIASWNRNHQARQSPAAQPAQQAGSLGNLNRRSESPGSPDSGSTRRPSRLHFAGTAHASHVYQVPGRSSEPSLGDQGQGSGGGRQD